MHSPERIGDILIEGNKTSGAVTYDWLIHDSILRSHRKKWPDCYGHCYARQTDNTRLHVLTLGFLFQSTSSSNWQSFHSAILMAYYHLTSPAVCPHTDPPDLFVLPLKISDRPKGQSEKCWCSIFSKPGSTCLEFTTFENPPLLVFVVFKVPTKNTSLCHRLSGKLVSFLCVYTG